MGFSLNQVMLVGKLGKDPETRFTTNNVAITTFNMATDRSVKKDDEWVQETTWHKVVVFNLSEFFRQQLRKGSMVVVTGRIDHQQYTDSDGNKKYSTQIVADTQNFIVCSSPNPRSTNGSEESVGDYKDDNDDLPF